LSARGRRAFLTGAAAVAGARWLPRTTRAQGAKSRLTLVVQAVPAALALLLVVLARA
jgi:hypothetical protein